jgi:3-dehydroquinate synthase
VRSSRGSYSVVLGSDLLRKVARHPAVAGRDCFLVTTARVLGLHGEKILSGFSRRERPVVLLVAEGEQHKRLRTVERLARELAAAGARRDALLLAFGGGMVGDIAGFLASIYLRGVEYVQVPTTLLAQVDSSVGGKTGVNLPEGKNLLGSFYPPRAVLADINTLQTLSDREFRGGLFECIKCGIMRSAKLFAYMEANRVAILHRDANALQKVIEQSVRIKARIVARDERESGERMLLNFGHTFGHALETALGYKTLLHGEAVGWGMVTAISLSAKLGGLSAAEATRAAVLIRAYGPLPRFKVTESAVMAAMRGDKKRASSGQRYVLANAIGSGFIAQGVPESESRQAVRELLREAGRA